MPEEVRIVYPDQLYPKRVMGSYLRTFNIAKLASEKFKTSIFGIASELYENEKCGVHVIQEKKYENFTTKLKHFSDGLFSDNYSLMDSKTVFKDFIPE
ncbi:MAG TPA: hypothetical protein DD434_09925, partial [Bacteroidales bacterium]|nr:hypothetical protein [Bacteroidales bacterium]